MSQDTSIKVAENNQLVADMFTDAVLDMYEQYQALKQQKEIFEYKVAQVCKKNGIKNVKAKYFNIEYREPTEQKRVNTDWVKNTKIYIVDEDTGELRKATEEEYMTISKVKESVRVKLK